MSRPVRLAGPTWVLAVVFGLGVFSSAMAAGDSVHGEALARQWCSGCHAVAPGEVGDQVVPSFESIVRERQRTTVWLETWLSVPHDAMPDLSLSRPDIADLVAYLESLRAAE